MATITEDSLRATVEEARGTLLILPRFLDNEPPPQNGGCGCWTYVSGTNGGQIRCGGMLTEFGVTEPYYCAYCQPEELSLEAVLDKIKRGQNRATKEAESE